MAIRGAVKEPALAVAYFMRKRAGRPARLQLAACALPMTSTIHRVQSDLNAPCSLSAGCLDFHRIICDDAHHADSLALARHLKNNFARRNCATFKLYVSAARAKSDDVKQRR